MHELGIVQSILEIIEQQAEINSATKVLGVELEFGALTAVMPEAIEFAFEALTKDSLAQGADLKITILPIKAICMDCGCESTLESYAPFCPSCSKGILNIVQGKDEMRIVSIEIE
jgi:hydrogenase nickel incorporation protein HypA/HybF